MSVRAAALLAAFVGNALAADPTPITTSQVVVSASPSSITFKASQVSDHTKYTQTGATVITVSGKASTIYHDGFVWVPSPSIASPPAVPTQYVPTTGNGNTIIVTATTGTPPPTVTFTASQDTKMSTVTAKTTSSGTTIFPFGWIWVPVPPLVGEPPLPPILPPVPTDAVPPEATQTPDDNGCQSTKTPTVTVVIAYSTNDVGDYQTSTSTKKATDVGTCLAKESTTTSTASAAILPTADDADADSTEAPLPTAFPAVDDAAQKYLEAAFTSLSYITPTTTAKPTQSCADNTYDKAIPSAAAFIHGLSPSFCSDWSAKPTNSLTKEYTAKNVKKRSFPDADALLQRRSIHEKRTPPPAPLTTDSYPGWEIDFTWKPKQPTGDCLKIDYCNKALDATLTHCEGYSLADAYKGGSYEDACGTFSYELKNYPQVKTTCAETPNPFSSKYLYRDDAMQAIQNFCTAQDGKSVTKGSAGINEESFSVTYATTNCGGQGSFTIKKDDCIKWLSATVDGCDTSQVNYKHGGTSVEQSTCASFAFHPTGYDQFACYPDNVQYGYAQSGGISVSNKIATTAIAQFCDRGGNNQYTLDPNNIPNPNSFVQDTCTTAGYAQCNYFFTTDGNLVTESGSLGDLTVELSAQYVDQSGCPPKAKYAIHGDQCHNELNKLLGIDSGTCSPVNGQYKLGSFLEHATHGCVLWTMSARATH